MVYGESGDREQLEESMWSLGTVVAGRAPPYCQYNGQHVPITAPGIQRYLSSGGGNLIEIKMIVLT